MWKIPAGVTFSSFILQEFDVQFEGIALWDSSVNSSIPYSLSY